MEDAKSDIEVALTIMRETCAQIDKGKDGADALTLLIDLWKGMELGTVSAESISILRAAVDELYEKRLGKH